MHDARPRRSETPSPPAVIPETRLMLAILDEALATYRKEVGRPGLKHRRRADEVEEWLFSDDIRWPFSFVNVCHTLGIDEGWIRGRLRHRASGLPRPGDANRIVVSSRRPEVLRAAAGDGPHALMARGLPLHR
jgi:hypothetical protein